MDNSGRDLLFVVLCIYVYIQSAFKITLKREKEGGRESVVSVDLACKEELNLMLVEASQGAVGLS